MIHPAISVAVIMTPYQKKEKASMVSHRSYSSIQSAIMVPESGLEPVQPKPRDFLTTSSFDARNRHENLGTLALTLYVLHPIAICSWSGLCLDHS